jgi:hypothetical protein
VATYRSNAQISYPLLMQGFAAGVTTDYDCTFHTYFVINGDGVIRYRGGYSEAAIRNAIDGGLQNLGVSSAGNVPAAGHRLLANHPNPFNPRTTIPFELAPGAGAAEVRLDILDLRGRLVATVGAGRFRRGERHRATWAGRDGAGRDLPSGVYLARLRVDGVLLTRSITLLK